MAFTIQAGTNISHWLSQREKLEGRAEYFTQSDVRRLKEMGFDHIRLPIDEEWMWEQSGARRADGFALMDSALDWCQAAGMKVIVDLHIVRSHYFNQGTEPVLFTDPKEEQKFCGLWRDLSAHLRQRPNDQVAYEFLNEPVARDPEHWNRVAHSAWRTLRELEPERVLVLGSNWFNCCDSYDRLKVPDDRRLLLTFHFYNPMPITHYRTSWWDGGVYDGPLNYPGVPIPEDAWAKLTPDLQARLKRWQRPYGREQMVEELAKPLAVAARTGLPLHCGEFGCYARCPQPLRLAWYRDVAAVFKAHGIAWSNWDFKGNFGLFDGGGNDTGIAAALLG